MAHTSWQHPVLACGDVGYDRHISPSPLTEGGRGAGCICGAFGRGRALRNGGHLSPSQRCNASLWCGILFNELSIHATRPWRWRSASNTQAPLLIISPDGFCVSSRSWTELRRAGDKRGSWKSDEAYNDRVTCLTPLTFFAIYWRNIIYTQESTFPNK